MRLTRTSHLSRTAQLTAAMAVAAVALAGCSPAADQSGAASQSAAQSEEDHDHEAEGTATEQAAAQTRLAMAYDGGILILNADDLSIIDDIALDGLSRVSDSGDGRHVVVSTTGKFQLLDMGTWAQAHGDHFHFYTDAPALTDVSYPAKTPGHVVAHGGHTVLFDDGTGLVQIVETAQVAEADAPTEDYTTTDPHHGVAVVLSDDTLLVTDGNEDSRNGLLALDAARKVVAKTDACESIHGEAVAEHEIAAFGCADGVVIYHGDAIEKIASPDADGAISTLAASEDSHVILGNYTLGDQEGDAVTKVSLIDTEKEKITAVDLGASYTFRSLARGDDGEALVLTTDGKLRVLDPETGKETAAHQVVSPWQVPADWQAPRPSIFAADGTAYVVDPSAKEIYAVDIETGEVWNKASLPQAVTEVAGVTGYPTSGEAAEDDHDHADDDHDHDHEEQS